MTKNNPGRMDDRSTPMTPEQLDGELMLKRAAIKDLEREINELGGKLDATKVLADDLRSYNSELEHKLNQVRAIVLTLKYVEVTNDVKDGLQLSLQRVLGI